MLPVFVIRSRTYTCDMNTNTGTTDLSDEQKEVLAVLQALLDAMAARDKDGMRATVIPGGGVTHSRVGGAFYHETLEQLCDRIHDRVQKVEAVERLYEPVVLIDDDIAMCWSPYDFLIDGEPSHWGTNIVSFLKRDGKWLISGIADNGRTTPKPENWPTARISLCVE
jgi:hypothetical protein